MSSIHKQVGSGTAHGNRQTTSYGFRSTDNNEQGANWGEQASRSLYSVMANHSDNRLASRSLINSRLWHGVPQLTTEQMNMFEAAYTGHTFIFITEMPKFMTSGIFLNTNLHYQAKNLKAIIERASTSFDGASNIEVDAVEMNNGNSRKISHIAGVHKDQNPVSLTLHEFAGLPVKNALEAWVTGVFDYRSEHGHYFGNLGIPGGWCLANHTMAMLVVQVDPSWQTIQDAAYYYNMFPQDVPFDNFNWRKGEHELIDNLQITFIANEERSPMIMYAAERYMNNRILSMVGTSVYNSRQFVVDDFYNGEIPKDYEGFLQNINRHDDDHPNNHPILDKQQYNIQVTGPSGTEYGNLNSDQSAIQHYEDQKNAGENFAYIRATGTPKDNEENWTSVTDPNMAYGNSGRSNYTY